MIGWKGVTLATAALATAAEALHKAAGGTVIDPATEQAVSEAEARMVVRLTRSLTSDLVQWLAKNAEPDGRVGSVEVIRVLDECWDKVEETFPELVEEMNQQQKEE